MQIFVSENTSLRYWPFQDMNFGCINILAFSLKNILKRYVHIFFNVIVNFWFIKIKVHVKIMLQNFKSNMTDVPAHGEIYYYFLWLCSPAPAMASSSTRFLDHTQRRATVGRTPLDE
jgi:hypothetical protein